MSHLVSVMMPCYNAARTLPWALSSLIAQTYAEWECVLVDDGSCPAGQITEVSGTTLTAAGVTRVRKCIPRSGTKKK